MAYSLPAPYADAVRAGLTYSYSVNATIGGVPIAGATGLAPTGGTITDTTKAGVRRALSAEFAPTAGLYDALKAYGTTLTVSATVVYGNQSTVSIPMGVFDVDQSSVSDGGGKLSLVAPDKWQRIVRATFVQPVSSVPGIKVTDQIVLLVQGGLGGSEQVIVSATSTATVGAMTWDPAQTSRAQAIIDLATGIGAYVYFDRNGVCRVDDVPTSQSASAWLIDASASGVLLSLDRSRDRTHTYNVVTVESSASAGALFTPQTVWDSDVNSATYAGTDPIANPASAGPFGIVTYHYSTPLVTDAGGARAAGLAILSRTIGVASQANLGTVPNPAMDAWDALDILPLGQAKPVITGYTPPVTATVTTATGALFPGPSTYPGASAFPASGSGGGTTTTVVDPGGAPIVTIAYSGAVLRRNIADTVTHPLDVSQPQTVQGRSTRTDPYS